MLRLIQNQWIWPSLTLTCLQARVVALQELHKAMSRWICLFFNSISKFLNLSFYQNCRKIIVLRFWKGKTGNTTIATCNCNSRNLPLGPLCLRQCFLNPSLSSVEWSDDLPPSTLPCRPPPLIVLMIKTRKTNFLKENGRINLSISWRRKRTSPVPRLC